MKKGLSVILAVLAIAVLAVSCDAAVAGDFFKTSGDMGCFRIVALRDNVSVAIQKYSDPQEVKLVYSTDNQNWKNVEFSGDAFVSLDEGETVYIKAGKVTEGNVLTDVRNTHFSKDDTNYYGFIIEGSAAVRGNIMYLLKTDPEGLDEVPAYAFANLFNNYCPSITEAPSLPAKKLNKGCYQYMFTNCYSLLAIPDLPAEELAVECYSNMFSECNSIREAVIPATKLAEGSCIAMFSYCDNLSKVEVSFTEWLNGSTAGWLEETYHGPCTFKCPSALCHATGYVTDSLFIPYGWKVVNR